MGDYADNDTIRAMEDMEDVPEALITEAIAWAEHLVDRETATSWVYRTFSVELDGTGTNVINLIDEEGRPILFVRTITSATFDGEAQDTSEWRAAPHGVLVTPSLVFPKKTVGGNVVISGTAGKTNTPPEDIAWCTRTLARQYILDLGTRLPERAMSINTPEGNITLAQATDHRNRPTSLPEVNARLTRNRQWRGF